MVAPLKKSVYLHNTGCTSAEANLKTLKTPFSFVSTLDFHYIWII